jgi:hypothetical protein
VLTKLGYVTVEERAPARTERGFWRPRPEEWAGLVGEKDLRFDPRGTRTLVLRYLVPALLLEGALVLWAVAASAPAAGLVVLVLILGSYTVLGYGNMITFSSEVVRITLDAPLGRDEKTYRASIARTFTVGVEAGRARTRNFAAKHTSGRRLSTFVPAGGDPVAAYGVLRELERSVLARALPSVPGAPEGPAPRP